MRYSGSMNFHIVTIFPEMLGSYLGESIIARAIKDKKIIALLMLLGAVVEELMVYFILVPVLGMVVVLNYKLLLV